jgi:hypothetical protein
VVVSVDVVVGQSGPIHGTVGGVKTVVVTGVVVVDETGSVEQSSPIHGEVESVKSVVVSVVEVDDIAVVQSSQGLKMMSSIAIASSAFPPQKA